MTNHARPAIGPVRGAFTTKGSTVQELIADFWYWRIRQQPRSSDDVPRVERPPGWTPDFSAEAVARYRDELAEFERRWAEARPDGSDRAAAVDHRLIGSAMARVRWELDVLRTWQRDPSFYVDQTVGVMFDLLTVRALTASRLADVRVALEAAPQVLTVARANLAGTGYREFAALTVAQLGTVDADLAATAEALALLDVAGWSDTDRTALSSAAVAAGRALVEFRSWLYQIGPSLDPARPVGREDFEWFLRSVALLPYSAHDLAGIGRMEADRAVFLELLERRRNGTPAGATPESRFADAEAQSAAEAEAETQVREFYVRRGLLSQPGYLRPYRTHLMPDHLAPIAWAGTADDLTGPSRLDQDGAAYFPTPSADLPYFYAANAHDPRAGIVHEGVHYQQLTISWRHPRPARRWYYDSCPNEGIAFYNEEMMLAAGLFDDEPRTREIICNFMRLRALRVVVDVRLAVGDFDIPTAAAFLQREVPMDAATAAHEAAFFAATPGQAMTYQVGKTQILRLLADAKAAAGADFDLQAFHDRLWREGNVPLALQRWELLDDRGELDVLDGQ